MLIKVTPKPKLSIAVRPRAPEPSGPALSTLAQEETSLQALSRVEAAEEVRVAYAIIAEMLPRVNLDPAACNIRVLHRKKFTSRMGDARAYRFDGAAPAGVIRISSSPLWRRAAPEKRRNTVIHELAHVLANWYAGRPVGHGDAWKRTMIRLGEEPARCHSVSVEGLQRRSRRSSRIVNSEADILDFDIGDRVTFKHKGRDVVATVTKYLRKRLVLAEEGRALTWRVTPNILRKMEA